MQTKQELENWYEIPDRWNYFQSDDDLIRKQNILGLLPTKYDSALDIGCGECFLTKDLPSDKIFGIELSDNAASRFPENVTRIHQPEGKYDLVISTGTLYPQYNHEQIYKWIMESASKHILIAGIKEWLLPYDFRSNVIESIEFKYGNYTQKVTLYEVI